MVAEVLRSGAFSDEVVVNLVNRRFVPFYYDQVPKGKNYGDAWAYDEAAVKAIGHITTERNGVENVNTGQVIADDYPAALFVTPDGKRLPLGMSGIIPPRQFVAELRKVMNKYPEYFKPSAEEKEIEARAMSNPKDAPAQLAAARLAWELADWDTCLARIEAGLAASPKQSDLRAEFTYLRGRVLTCQDMHAEALQAFAEADRASKEGRSGLADAILVGRARVLMNQQKYREALELYKEVIEKFPKQSHIGEAYYYAGLCCHWMNDKHAAKEFWRKHRKCLPNDRLARRSATSLGLPEAEAFLNQELVDRKGWW